MERMCRRCGDRPANIRGLCGPCNFSKNGDTGGQLCRSCGVRRAVDSGRCRHCQQEREDEDLPWPYNLM